MRCLERGAGEPRALGRPARAHPGPWPAQLAADRDRADRDHRLDRRLLRVRRAAGVQPVQARDAVRRLPAGRSEEHTSELQSLMRISYAVFCLKKKNTTQYSIVQIIQNKTYPS